MMKKLMILMLVLGMASLANAYTVQFEVTGGDEPIGGSYRPSDIITIGLVGYDFTYNNPIECFYSLKIATVTSSAGGTASDPNLHDELKGSQPFYVGTVVNSGSLLIQTVQGTGAVGDYQGVPNGTAAWWFDFHVPDVQESTIITLDLTGLVVKNAFGGDLSPTFNPLEIHVVPEPMTIALLGLGGLFLRRRKK